MPLKVYLDGWEPQTRYPLAPANQCMVSAMINAFNLSPRAAAVVAEGPFPKLIIVEPSLSWAQRGIKIIVDAGGTIHVEVKPLEPPEPPEPPESLKTTWDHLIGD